MDLEPRPHIFKFSNRHIFKSPHRYIGTLNIYLWTVKTGNMGVIISMLRGINVSGQKKVPMKELKALYEELGFTRVSTYIQSGNVVFETREKTDGLVRKIEKALHAHFGFEVSVIHRTPEELATVLENNPFLKEKDLQADKLYVSFLAETPGAEHIEKARAYQTGADRFEVSGRETYLYLPDGYGRTKFHNNFMEGKLKVTATTRNWKTVNELYTMARNLQTPPAP